ncbi:CAP domain-containing protein [uncultured Cocleimonas sp.]|uniref:CAP domain-containing protein n=1 Tax=uncultured Cocleimonas sp. TaxID=1051587 RepID=UPI00260D7DCD|nr:CAP domain-containing protein [uncultured Cocleimonas sp.]
MKRTLPLFVLAALLLLNASSFASEPAQFSGILSSHNQVRAQYNQQPLSWSNELSKYAQQWVDHLAQTQNCEMIHRPNQSGGQFQQIHGENLFWASPEEFSGGVKKIQRFHPTEVVKAWAEEANFYDYQNNRCQPGQDCGHFTQMVWHESQQVGCAKAICPDKSQIWACNYHPRGNYIGEWPY